MKNSLLKRILINNTKIVATIGPATRNKKMLLHLIQEGVDVFRLNLSHGSYRDHSQTIRYIREINEKLDCITPVFIDLQGPKIRVDEIKNGKIQLKRNQILKIIPKKIMGDHEKISISNKNLYNHVKSGEKILMDDGKFELRVLKIEKKEIITKVIHSGELSSRKGVNLPRSQLKIPALTEKDKADIQWGLKQNINIFALSFVRTKDDILNLKKYIKSLTNKKITIIAKIEKPQAVKNISAIIEQVDGIMVARGDLGVEVSPAKVPLIQKKLIHIANQNKKFVITATQMLESMITNSIPTRAETTDIFNAVLDGTDAVMLSGETAIGKFPINTVQIMNQVLKNAEAYLKKCQNTIIKNKNETNSEIIAKSINQITRTINPKYIIAFTNSGMTAQLISSKRPTSSIITFSPHKQIINKLIFYYGVFPFVLKQIKYTGQLLPIVRSFLLNKGLVKKDDQIIISLGVPLIEQPQTNSIIIYTIN